MPALVIFDCDGVLIDSEVLSCDILIDEGRRGGIFIDRDFVFRNCIGKTFDMKANPLARATARELPRSFESDYRDALQRAFDNGLKPMAGGVGILKALRGGVWVGHKHS